MNLSLTFFPFHFQVLAVSLVRATNAKLEAKPETAKDLGEEILVRIENPETHQTQYHTADFSHSK